MSLALWPTTTNATSMLDWSWKPQSPSVHGSPHVAQAVAQLSPSAPSTHVGAHSSSPKEKDLDIGFKAITFSSYGGFGKSAHDLITKATSGTTKYVCYR